MGHGVKSILCIVLIFVVLGLSFVEIWALNAGAKADAEQTVIENTQTSTIEEPAKEQGVTAILHTLSLAFKKTVVIVTNVVIMTNKNTIAT